MKGKKCWIVCQIQNTNIFETFLLPDDDTIHVSSCSNLPLASERPLLMAISSKFNNIIASGALPFELYPDIYILIWSLIDMLVHHSWKAFQAENRESDIEPFVGYNGCRRPPYSHKRLHNHWNMQSRRWGGLWRERERERESLTKLILCLGLRRWVSSASCVGWNFVGR